MFDIETNRVKAELKIDFKTTLNDNAVIPSIGQLQHVVTHIKTVLNHQIQRGFFD